MIERHPGCSREHPNDLYGCASCMELTRLERLARGEHEGTVFYTTDDDGVWVGCWVCAWDEGLGFGPSPERVSEVWKRHVEGL